MTTFKKSKVLSGPGRKGNSSRSVAPVRDFSNRLTPLDKEPARMKNGALRLICIPPRVPDHEIVGIKEIANILPPVRRLPGEALENMLRRAIDQARGSGDHRMHLQLRSEGGAA